MCAQKVIFCLVLALFYAVNVHGAMVSDRDASVSGNAFETLLNNTQSLHDKLTVMESAMKKDRVTAEQKYIAMQAQTKKDREFFEKKLTEVAGAIKDQSQVIAQTLNAALTNKDHLQVIERKLTDINGVISELKQTVANNMNTLPTATNQLSQMILTALHNHTVKAEQTANAKHELMIKKVQMLVSTTGLSQTLLSSGLNLVSLAFESCKKNSLKRTGKYLIQQNRDDQPFLGLCEQNRFGGGWLVIQYRFNGSLDFYRNWAAYQNGFGNVDGEFWIGLERMHRLTSARPHELLIEIKDFSGNYAYARYSDFKIGSKEKHYPLEKLGSYTGTAGDSLTRHKGMKFTTNDRDNDAYKEGNCAIRRHGAWWYRHCYSSNLNGKYVNHISAQSMNWVKYKSNHLGLAYSRMLIREL